MWNLPSYDVNEMNSLVGSEAQCDLIYVIRIVHCLYLLTT